MSTYTNALISVLESNADFQLASRMAQYMKNQFIFFGIQKPMRSQIVSDFARHHGKPDEGNFRGIIKELWDAPQRECQYIAIEFLKKSSKFWQEDDILFLEQLICDKSWWDSVDALAANICGKYFLRFPHHAEPITSKWNASENLWLIRSSIIFQLTYKEKVNEELLFRYMEVHIKDNEFFIQKAIGWALRQYSKHKPERVKAFVDKHSLSTVARREAIKYL